MVKESKRLACRFGFHSWYVDSDGAFFSQVRRCSHCPAVSDKNAAAELDRERRAWREVAADGGSFSQRLGRVMGILSYSTASIVTMVERGNEVADLPYCVDMMGHGNMYGDHFVCATCGGRIPDERTGD